MNESTGARASITADDWTATVLHFGSDPDGRERWAWRIEHPSGPWEFGGDDLTGPRSADPDPRAMLETLGGFLGAYAEAIEYERRHRGQSENADLFEGLPEDAAAALSEAIALDALDRGHVCWVDDSTCPDCSTA